MHFWLIAKQGIEQKSILYIFKRKLLSFVLIMLNDRFILRLIFPRNIFSLKTIINEHLWIARRQGSESYSNGFDALCCNHDASTCNEDYV